MQTYRYENNSHFFTFNFTGTENQILLVFYRFGFRHLSPGQSKKKKHIPVSVEVF